MILIDSSVWIDFFNGKPTPQTLKLQSLMGHEPLLVGDLILCEVLQGARNETDAEKLENALRKFEIVSLLNADLAIASATHYRALRAEGVTVRKTIDLIIGTFCIVHEHTLLHADRDFEPMETYLGLKTVGATWTVNELP